MYKKSQIHGLFRRTVACAAVLLSLSAGAATVQNVNVTTNYPWSGLVTVAYDVAGVTETCSMTAQIVAGGETYAVCETNLTGDVTGASFAWDAAAAGFRGRAEDAKVVFSFGSPLYAVIDVSAGSATNKYDVTYPASVGNPATNDAYKTDKILLKRVCANGITNYVGVFEITQRQYERVMGEGKNPSFFSNYKGLEDDNGKVLVTEAQALAIERKRPVERVSYDDLTKAAGFFSNLCAKTGLALALPTAAEWEAAARGNMPDGKEFNLGAGDYHKLCNDKTDDAWLPRMGRYGELWRDGKRYQPNDVVLANPYLANDASDETFGTAIVGSYPANDNGLYDMHGNVAEWTQEAGEDDQGNACRLLRGGSWKIAAGNCDLDAVKFGLPQSKSADHEMGFRVFGGAAVAANAASASASFVLDIVGSSGERQVCAKKNGDAYDYFYLPERTWRDGRWTNAVTNAWVSFPAKGVAAWKPTQAGLNVVTNAADDAVTAAFRVAPLDFAEVTVVVTPSRPYDRTATNVSYAVSGLLPVAADDYTVTWDPRQTAGTAGVYTVVFAPSENGNYAGAAREFPYEITAAEITGWSFGGDIRLPWNGAAQTVKPAEGSVKAGALTLEEGEYSITNPSATDVGSYTSAIRAQSPNFKDPSTETNLTWEIVKREVTGDALVVTYDTTKPILYTGGELNVTNYILSIAADCGTAGKLTISDYTLSDLVATNAGTHTAKLTAKSPFTNSTEVTVEWTVAPRDIRFASFAFKQNRLAWTGAALAPEIDAITFEDEIGRTNITLRGDALAGLSVVGTQTDAGFYRSALTGTGNFTGTTYREADWSIVPGTPGITPSNPQGVYKTGLSYVTVSITNAPASADWTILFSTNDVDWIVYDPDGPQGGKFDLRHHALVRACAVSANGSVTGGVAQCEYFFGTSEDLALPKILLQRPDGVLTNSFRNTADCLVITNVPSADPMVTNWYAGVKVRYAIVPDSVDTNAAARPAESAFRDYPDPAVEKVFFQSDSNVVWVVASSDYHRSSYAVASFVRKLDTVGKPTIHFDNTANRTNVYVTILAPADAADAGVYYTYWITNGVTDVTNAVQGVAEPRGPEYDAAKCTIPYTNGVPFNVVLKPEETLIVKARAYREDGTTGALRAETNFTARSEVAADVLKLDWTIGDALDAPDQVFNAYLYPDRAAGTNCVADTQVFTKGDAAIVIRDLGDGETCLIETTVYGPGTVSFDWKTICSKGQTGNNRDYFSFRVDADEDGDLAGGEICRLDGDSGWQSVTNKIVGEKFEPHTLVWAYVKDESEKYGEDSAWLDNFQWTPSETQLELNDELRDQAVEWVGEEEYNTSLCPGGSDNLANWYDLLKRVASNGRSYYECYVLGLDEEDPNDDFKIDECTVATSAFGEKCGVTVVWSPCVLPGRKYVLVGCEALPTDNWKNLAENSVEVRSTDKADRTISTQDLQGCQYFGIRVYLED